MSSDQRRIFNAKTITNLGFGQQSRQEFYADIIPSNDASFDLGAAGLRWKNVFSLDSTVSNNLNVGGDVQVTGDIIGNDKFVINSASDAISPTDDNASMQTEGGLAVAKTIHCTDLVVADQTELKGKNVVTDTGDATSNTDVNASIKTSGGIAVAKKVYANNLQAADTVSGANASFLAGQFVNCDVINDFTCGNFAISGSFHIPGSLGIGLNPPSYKLDIYSNTNGITPVMRLQSGVTVGNTGSRILIGGNSYNAAIDGVHKSSGHTNLIMHTSYSNVLYERLRIDEFGRVGLNQTNPTTLLELFDNTGNWPAEKLKIYSLSDSPKIALGNSDSNFRYIESTPTKLCFGVNGKTQKFLTLQEDNLWNHEMRYGLTIKYDQRAAFLDGLTGPTNLPFTITRKPNFTPFVEHLKYSLNTDGQARIGYHPLPAPGQPFTGAQSAEAWLDINSTEPFIEGFEGISPYLWIRRRLYNNMGDYISGSVPDFTNQIMIIDKYGDTIFNKRVKILAESSPNTPTIPALQVDGITTINATALPSTTNVVSITNTTNAVNNLLLLHGGTTGTSGARILIGGSSSHYSSIVGQQIGGGATDLKFGTTGNVLNGAPNSPVVRMTLGNEQIAPPSVGSPTGNTMLMLETAETGSQTKLRLKAGQGRCEITAQDEGSGRASLLLSTSPSTADYPPVRMIISQDGNVGMYNYSYLGGNTGFKVYRAQSTVNASGTYSYNIYSATNPPFPNYSGIGNKNLITSISGCVRDATGAIYSLGVYAPGFGYFARINSADQLQITTEVGFTYPVFWRVVITITDQP